MTVTASLLDKMNLVDQQLEYLNASIDSKNDRKTRQFSANGVKVSNKLTIDKVTDKRCEILAIHRLLLGSENSDEVHCVESKVRSIFRIEQPMTRQEIEANIKQVEQVVFGPTTLITAFVTREMGFPPVIVPPFTSDEDAVTNEQQVTNSE